MDRKKEQEKAFIGRAMELAQHAEKAGDVPVGAVVVVNGKIVGEGYNTREAEVDPVGHAEVMALREAGKRLGRWRLDDADLYVTLEPCTMCAGAILGARIRRVFFGAWDEKAGAAGSVRDVLRDSRMNHQVEVYGGICEEEVARQLVNFFDERRALR
ncbi:tRNA adenosine(34) deaminase TadA [Actinotignum urinale]|uniref:tRNA-specific adenosine deaminase n=1 Tax=Actinotignum urinale TaxID=190146 RepID=A0ABU5G949_9ACTO|nr:tRNA adenosine(34) deaminase TadA [Actinotignum urinale]MDY5129296.1 tRNA adenosine(34) deaminase TadA [Actinotignum urinale]MDY5133242.1 tRNA adenosine(34) deaminase TadA [Actinotignum urinale]